MNSNKPSQDTINLVLKHLSALRESSKETPPNRIHVGGLWYIRESLIEFEEPPDKYDTNLTGTRESLKDIPVESEEALEFLWDKYEKPKTKTKGIIKDIMMMMETDKKLTVVEELEHRFNASLGELNNHRDKLENVIRKLTGESLREAVGEGIDEEPMGNQLEMTEPSTIDKLDKKISRLEQVNREFGKLYEVLNQYL